MQRFFTLIVVMVVFLLSGLAFWDVVQAEQESLLLEYSVLALGIVVLGYLALVNLTKPLKKSAQKDQKKDPEVESQEIEN